MPKFVILKSAPVDVGFGEEQWTLGGDPRIVNAEHVVAIWERSDAPDGTKRSEVVLANRGMIVIGTPEQVLHEIEGHDIREEDVRRMAEQAVEQQCQD